MKETDDYAGQREVIAEETKEKVLNDMHNVASHSKNERKKVKNYYFIIKTTKYTFLIR